jgi:hypothetical protein
MCTVPLPPRVYPIAVNKYIKRKLRIIKKNTEALLDGSKEFGLEVNADKTKCMVMSGDHNAGRSHNMKVDNRRFERWKSSNILEQP